MRRLEAAAQPGWRAALAQGAGPYRYKIKHGALCCSIHTYYIYIYVCVYVKQCIAMQSNATQCNATCFFSPRAISQIARHPPPPALKIPNPGFLRFKIPNPEFLRLKIPNPRFLRFKSQTLDSFVSFGGWEDALPREPRAADICDFCSRVSEFLKAYI